MWILKCRHCFSMLNYIITNSRWAAAHSTTQTKQPTEWWRIMLIRYGSFGRWKLARMRPSAKSTSSTWQQRNMQHENSNFKKCHACNRSKIWVVKKAIVKNEGQSISCKEKATHAEWRCICSKVSGNKKTAIDRKKWMATNTRGMS